MNFLTLNTTNYESMLLKSLNRPHLISITNIVNLELDESKKIIVRHDTKKDILVKNLLPYWSSIQSHYTSIKSSNEMSKHYGDINIYISNITIYFFRIKVGDVLKIRTKLSSNKEKMGGNYIYEGGIKLFCPNVFMDYLGKVIEISHTTSNLSKSSILIQIYNVPEYKSESTTNTPVVGNTLLFEYRSFKSLWRPAFYSKHSYIITPYDTMPFMLPYKSCI